MPLSQNVAILAPPSSASAHSADSFPVRPTSVELFIHISTAFPRSGSACSDAPAHLLVLLSRLSGPPPFPLDPSGGGSGHTCGCPDGKPLSSLSLPRFSGKHAR